MQNMGDFRSMAMQIRSIQPSDYDPIIAVVDAWWGGRQMAAMLPRLFFRHFRETSFVAEQNSDRVGFLIGFLSDTYPDEAYIHFVGVHPDHRKTGIGRTLYDSFFQKIRQKERKVIRSVTSPINLNSIAFHRRMGFKLEASSDQSGAVPIHRNYDGPGEDRVLFIKKLNFRNNG